MWKKIMIGCIMLFATVSLAYAYCSQELNAATSTYKAGGNVTGRVNKSPTNLLVMNSGMQKGDKLDLGLKNENNVDLPFQLIYKLDDYTQYTISGVRGSYSFPISTPISGWISAATIPYGNKTNAFSSGDAFHIKSVIWTPNTESLVYDLPDYTESYSILYPKMKSLNQQIDSLKHKNDIIAPRDLTNNAKYYAEGYSVKSEGIDQSITAGEYGRHAYMFDLFTLSRCDSAACTTYKYTGLEGKDTTFVDSYWTNTFPSGSDTGKYAAYWIGGSDGIVQPCSKYVSSVTQQLYLRPFLNIDPSNIVFAVSKGSSSSFAKITTPILPSGYTSLYAVTNQNPSMKIRIEDASLSASTNFNQIENASQSAISKTVVNSSVYLNVDAQAGDDGNGGIYTVSALIFNENGDFKLYKPLEAAKGSGFYELDLTNIPLGKYKIGIVNEAYNDNSTAPAESSAITDVFPLEIVESHKLSYTKQPQSGASAGIDYEFSKNVNASQTVGKITVNPQGVMPLTYTIETNGDNTYQNFEIDGLNSSGASSSTSLNVKIKSNAPDLVNGGLKAGDYKFCVSAVDANGDPTSVTTDSKVCTSFTVEKTNLTVAFDDSNQTKKSITDAATVWNETATAAPNNSDVKITYSKVGGDIGLIDIDSDTGAITYKGNGAYGKVKIRATADDDSSSGNDNYNSAFVEKEIVIYAEVNGSVTPHANSSDISTPTFSANDPNIKINGTIGTIKGSPGTPDDVTGSRFTYTYGLKNDGDGSFFAVNASTGVITTKANLAVGSYTITVTVSDKWSTKEIPVTINVGMAAAEDLKFYENSSSNVAITTKSAKATDTNVTVYATVKGSSNSNPVKYSIKDGSTNIIEINEDSGAITIHGVGTVTIVAEKQGGVGQAKAVAELTFTVTAGSQNFIYTDNAGNELPKDGSDYKAYSEVYAPTKTFQLYTAGNPTGSTVNYQLKAGSPTDVISVDASGLVTILNASLNNQMGKVIVEATSHDPTGNYSDKTIELSINIEKGTRVISFKEKPIYVTNGKGKVTPVTEVDGVVDTDGDVLIEVDTNEDHTIAWTNDNKTVDYNYSGETGKDIKIHATKPMNRNYKAAEADGTIHIMGPDENILAITSPGQIIYGDHFTIRSSQYDADSTNVQYTFEVDKTTYISSPTVNGNSAEFDAKQFSGSNKTTITVTRTADGETMLSKQVQVTVLPKPIEITIDDKEKLKGEQNPVLTYQDFRSELVSWNGVQDVIQENDIKLSTTAKTDSNAGDYPIKGDSNTLNKTYPNYSFSFKEGTLTIKEEAIEDDWYHLELDDGNNTAYTGDWTNQDVNIISDHNEYINLSLDGSTWKPNQVTVTKEGETNQSFWMKKDSGAITKEKQELIKIDKTAPKVKGIKAKDTNNKLQDIINKLSGGIFFKPGTSFEITTDDTKDDLKVSGTKEIAYKVYKTEAQSRAGDELIKEGNLAVTNEKASITISETTGTYKVCVIPTDNAGNTNTESCHEVELKKIDVDVDGDGKPDFNDSDGDGCPDLNIKWKDPDDETKWIVVNGDRNYDGTPDLNIDSDGDGKPDLNIDTDNDGKPDLNLVILKKSDWKPTKCVKQDIDNVILEEYCTGTSVKAVINIDTDGDYIPDINIDTNGDMKADINIDTDNDSKANVNIAPPHSEWKPDKNYSYGKPSFPYDTVDKYEPLLNIDTDGDGRPDINLDIDDDGVADLNIDTDNDGIPNINIDSTGDGKPDINIDLDDDGKPDENIKDITEWKPNKNIDGEFPYDTMSFAETNKPIEPNKDNDADVKGNYYPGDNVGGAITGDGTDIIKLVIFMILSGIIIGYLVNKYQKNTFQ